jgi:uncharacterized damage-inducible protein DinB
VEAFSATTPAELPTLANHENKARDAHERAPSLFAAMTDERLAAPIDIPWFRDPPVDLTVEQALLQAAMHSHYHRGQNATRLRELGGEPPITDLIAWYWKRKPLPHWQ